MHWNILVFSLCFLCRTDAIEMTYYWKDHKILPPIVDSINAKSMPSCIHRCTTQKNCNIIAVSTISLSNSSCLFGWMECYEKFSDKIISANGWDVYAVRDKGSLPFILAFRINSVRMCTKIDQSGLLVLTHDCHDLFCKNSLNQIVNVETRKCLSTRNKHESGADVAVSTTCNELSVFREVDKGMQQVATMWHMHPYTSHQNPPEGTKVMVWISNTYWFYFDYKNHFL